MTKVRLITLLLTPLMFSFTLEIVRGLGRFLPQRFSQAEG